MRVTIKVDSATTEQVFDLTLALQQTRQFFDLPRQITVQPTVTVSGSSMNWESPALTPDHARAFMSKYLYLEGPELPVPESGTGEGPTHRGVPISPDEQVAIDHIRDIIHHKGACPICRLLGKDEGWVETGPDRLPMNGTRVVGLNSKGHTVPLLYRDNLWWLADSSTYIYWTPTQWRYIP